MIPPETTWVVESEKPKYEDERIAVAEPVSAENPCGDSISVTRVPSVLITRQPPEKVPSAIAVAHTIFTQTGIPAVGRKPTSGDEDEHDDAHRLLRVVRAVRERDHRARRDLAEAKARLRALRLRTRASAGRPSVVATNAARPQMNGASTAGITTFDAIPLQITADEPTPAITDPTTPPTSACDEEDGIPRNQVITFQRIAPIRPAKMIGTVT